jgi:hypothetical protein
LFEGFYEWMALQIVNGGGVFGFCEGIDIGPFLLHKGVYFVFEGFLLGESEEAEGEAEE